MALNSIVVVLVISHFGIRHTRLNEHYNGFMSLGQDKVVWNLGMSLKCYALCLKWLRVLRNEIGIGVFVKEDSQS